MCVLLSLIVKVNEAFDVTFTCTVTRLFNVACFTSPVRRESVAISPEEGNWGSGQQIQANWALCMSNDDTLLVSNETRNRKAISL